MYGAKDAARGPRRRSSGSPRRSASWPRPSAAGRRRSWKRSSRTSSPGWRRWRTWPGSTSNGPSARSTGPAARGAGPRSAHATRRTNPDRSGRAGRATGRRRGGGLWRRRAARTIPIPLRGFAPPSHRRTDGRRRRPRRPPTPPPTGAVRDVRGGPRRGGPDGTRRPPGGRRRLRGAGNKGGHQEGGRVPPRSARGRGEQLLRAARGLGDGQGRGPEGRPDRPERFEVGPRPGRGRRLRAGHAPPLHRRTGDDAARSRRRPGQRPPGDAGGPELRALPAAALRGLVLPGSGGEGGQPVLRRHLDHPVRPAGVVDRGAGRAEGRPGELERRGEVAGRHPAADRGVRLSPREGREERAAGHHDRRRGL